MTRDAIVHPPRITGGLGRPAEVGCPNCGYRAEWRNWRLQQSEYSQGYHIEASWLFGECPMCRCSIRVEVYEDGAIWVGEEVPEEEK